jgi:hypothetical protein
MKNLLKADYYKLFKSKMTYILIIICALLSIFTLLLEVFLKFVIKELDADFPLSIEGRSIMFGTLSLTNNTGLLIIIFVGIFTLTDIKHGTIRNKILCGENRIKIYLSHLIVSSTMCLIASIISFLILAIGGIAIFGYGPVFNGEEALNFIRCSAIGIVSYIFVASVSTFFALLTKSTPLTIILTLAILLGLSIISAISFSLPTKFKSSFYIVPTYATTIASQGYVSAEVFTYGIISLIVFIAINTILGIYFFRKIDVK